MKTSKTIAVQVFFGGKNIELQIYIVWNFWQWIQTNQELQGNFFFHLSNAKEHTKQGLNVRQGYRTKIAVLWAWKKHKSLVYLYNKGLKVKLCIYTGQGRVIVHLEITTWVEVLVTGVQKHFEHLQGFCVHKQHMSQKLFYRDLACAKFLWRKWKMEKWKVSQNKRLHA